MGGGGSRCGGVCVGASGPHIPAGAPGRLHPEGVPLRVDRGRGGCILPRAGALLTLGAVSSALCCGPALHYSEV